MQELFSRCRTLRNKAFVTSRKLLKLLHGYSTPSSWERSAASKKMRMILCLRPNIRLTEFKGLMYREPWSTFCCCSLWTFQGSLSRSQPITINRTLSAWHFNWLFSSRHWPAALPTTRLVPFSQNSLFINFQTVTMQTPAQFHWTMPRRWIPWSVATSIALISYICQNFLFITARNYAVFIILCSRPFLSISSLHAWIFNDLISSCYAAFYSIFSVSFRTHWFVHIIQTRVNNL